MSFFVPTMPTIIEFLFLPSDQQYCGIGGPEDKNFDPRPEPSLRNIVMEFRAFPHFVPEVELVPEDAAVAAPRTKRALPEWFSGFAPRLDAAYYNRMLRLASLGDDDLRELIQASRVQGGHLISAGFLIHDDAGLANNSAQDAPPAGIRNVTRRRLQLRTRAARGPTQPSAPRHARRAAGNRPVTRSTASRASARPNPSVLGEGPAVPAPSPVASSSRQPAGSVSHPQHAEPLPSASVTSGVSFQPRLPPLPPILRLTSLSALRRSSAVRFPSLRRRN